MTVEEARPLIEAARERNAIGRAIREAVDRLFCRYGRRLARAHQEQEEYVAEGWVFLLGRKGQRVRQRAAIARDPNAYTVQAVYRHLLRYASRECRFGQYSRRPVTCLPGDGFLSDRPDTKIKFRDSHTELALLLEDASPDVRIYLEGRLKGKTDCDMKSEWKCTRTAFEDIRATARVWLARQYPEQVGSILNAVSRPELLQAMEALYGYCVTEDRLCSVLFTPEEGDCYLWGSLAEVVGGSLCRPIGPGPRLALDLEEVMPSLGKYMAGHSEPAHEPPPGKFWVYLNIGF